uniref:dihydrofolate reductase n=1 Tax=Florenciella parvula TaxID=236787 RepID=A0A7S2BA08_9STRA|mmetsp:Transcript_14608/g.30623  ORF Transcript_14608/g.30623 Transcript_14608/m.30623 type:complete len:207 (+) Transcript_14608:58-678(+)
MSKRPTVEALLNSCPRLGQRLGIIAAVASPSGIIGIDGKLPWSIPEDRAWFERHVQAGILILGRRSWEETGASIPGVRGSVVVSSTPRPADYYGPATASASSLDDALESASFMAAGAGVEEPTEAHATLWIGGGFRLYEEAMALARPKALYLTRIHGDVPGDTKFPTGWEDGFFLRWQSGHFPEIGAQVGGVSFEVWHDNGTTDVT